MVLENVQFGVDVVGLMYVVDVVYDVLERVGFGDWVWYFLYQLFGGEQ